MTPRPNILFFTADDMNGDAVGAFGCAVAGTTPSIDRLAAEGLRFEHGHVTIAVCQPSRSALLTGRYPHRSGGEGFFHLRCPGIPILPDLLRRGGYRVGILGKYTHSTPYADFRWDLEQDRADLGHGRNPALYADHAGAFMRDAAESGRAFFLMLNSHDPHRPFYGNDPRKWYDQGDVPPAVAPSRTFEPDETPPPGFLPDLPDVRLEISEYYNSVRRCDDTVGAVLSALDDAGTSGNTIVIFLSDNGMAFPFSKTNCYLHSTRTPWIMRWPGVIAPGRVDAEHMIGGVDLMPTLLEAAGVDPPAGMDGRSFLPVLRGETLDDRELVFTQFHRTAAKRNYPMRCVQSRRFGYIFNPWSNGERRFLNESQGGRTWRAMQAAAADRPDIAARAALFTYRVAEELYDFGADPDALHNLIDDPAYAEPKRRLTDALEQWMVDTDDVALDAFRQRHDPAAREACVQQAIAELGGE